MGSQPDFLTRTVPAGTSLHVALREAMAEAARKGVEVRLRFTSAIKAVTIRVTKQSKLERLLAAFDAASEGDIIGP